ncbi:MAG: flagellar export chaperone FliS [Rhodocyclaceae bacterium]|jgi:flagellar protein FliS|nr:flagellar export chaperone FliS [Rhodocyclaceae bacterium]MCE2723932.1 flagellar export chaperone FliS [Betaproteobacteria bacterium]MCA3020690.1 flagellar export chaperone FliS [Rhodocyclaceae bacterium]MCA3026671.1 flagellar export chaperone FliS [Rhodocyclaceae bacterium]MCA3029564.1 flagellar export chaperone FliS [Rhodocyclaceae bacterium]
MIDFSASHQFGPSKRRAAFAYAETNILSGTLDASPHTLILMLIDGALEAIGQAQAHLASNNTPAKNAAASKALRIIEEGLRASLDRGNGGSIAQRLDELYDYMARRMLLANLKNDPGGYAEVGRLLQQVRSGWVGIVAVVDSTLGAATLANHA